MFMLKFCTSSAHPATRWTPNNHDGHTRLTRWRGRVKEPKNKQPTKKRLPVRLPTSWCLEQCLYDLTTLACNFWSSGLHCNSRLRFASLVSDLSVHDVPLPSLPSSAASTMFLSPVALGRRWCRRQEYLRVPILQCLVKPGFI